jgi:predicted transcriptional regulator
MGQLEEEVLAALWAAGCPVTPNEVRDAMNQSLAYNTVTTVLQRLWRKGLTRREPRGRAYAYEPSQSRAEMAAEKMLAQIERATDPEAVLASFAGGLSTSDALALRDILARMGKR